MLKFQLFNDALGAITLETDPDGSNDFELALKRSKKSDGIFFEFSVDLAYVKEGRRFIRSAYETQGGIDAVVGLNIYSYNPNAYSWELEYKGQIKMSTYKINETSVEATVEQTGFQRKFLNLEKVDVELDNELSLGGLNIGKIEDFQLTLNPIKILQKLDAQPPDENEFLTSAIVYFEIPSSGVGTTFNRYGKAYAIPSTENRILDDFDSAVQRGYGYSEIGALEFFNVTPQESGIADIDIKLTIQHRIKANPGNENIDVVGCGDSALGHITIKAFYEHQDSEGNVIIKQQMGSDYVVPNCPNQAGFISEFETKEYQQNGVQLNVGDKLFAYYEIEIEGEYDTPNFAGATFVDHDMGMTSDNENTHFKVNVKTEYPSTEVKTNLIYEVIDQVVSSYVDVRGVFYSDYFGRTDIGYAEDGEGSLLGFFNGRRIRQLESDSIFTNWKDLIASLEAIYCLGWGFEKTDSGGLVVRCEPKSFFYDKGLKVHTFEQVSDLSKDVSMDYFHQTIRVGYDEVENINQLNGIDEFNSERKFVSPVTNSDNELNIISKYRASSFEIESQRRLIGQTQESKLDDKNFFICLKRVGQGYEVETGSDFESVTGLFDPDGVYNLSISPARNIRRWSKILASNVIRSRNKVFAFNFGNYNYNVSSKKAGEAEIFENGNLDLEAEEAIYYPEIIEFDAKVKRDLRKQILENMNGHIEFVDWEGNTSAGFILNMNSEIEANKGDFKLLRMFKY